MRIATNNITSQIYLSEIKHSLCAICDLTAKFPPEVLHLLVSMQMYIWSFLNFLGVGVDGQFESLEIHLRIYNLLMTALRMV